MFRGRWISVFQRQIQLSIRALSSKPQKKIYQSHSSYYGYIISGLNAKTRFLNYYNKFLIIFGRNYPRPISVFPPTLWKVLVCRRKMRLKEGNAIMQHDKKGFCGGVYLSEAHNPKPPCTLYRQYCTILIHTGKRGRGESWTREKVGGATVHKAGSKIPTGLAVSPVYKLW
jgi:hypothetical protein